VSERSSPWSRGGGGGSSSERGARAARGRGRGSEWRAVVVEVEPVVRLVRPSTSPSGCGVDCWTLSVYLSARWVHSFIREKASVRGWHSIISGARYSDRSGADISRWGLAGCGGAPKGSGRTSFAEPISVPDKRQPLVPTKVRQLGPVAYLSTSHNHSRHNHSPDPASRLTVDHKDQCHIRRTTATRCRRFFLCAFHCGASTRSFALSPARPRASLSRTIAHLSPLMSSAARASSLPTRAASATSAWNAEGVVAASRKFDVVVVGGGFAGLAAAYRLLLAHQERKVRRSPDARSSIP